MLGAVAGDIIGSTYEFYNTKSMDFELFEQGCRFTDDSVMTLSVAKWLTEDEAHTIPYLIYCMQELGHLHADAGYDWRPLEDHSPNISLKTWLINGFRYVVASWLQR